MTLDDDGDHAVHGDDVHHDHDDDDGVHDGDL
jgi:hypothetical protein